ncbi:MAG: sulfite exporter TauE/SafE family protein [Firmicutes bacterium]|nr:sulfite exporter TauE/SafE family protein [Bacillota bacterium]
MSYVVFTAAFFTAVLTLLTGFGLATILTPIFSYMYDIKIAVLLVAVVHFLNNLLKVVLFRKDISITVLKRFGILSIIGALVGSLSQAYIYSGSLKVFLGVVLVFLGLKEVLPRLEGWKIPQRYDTFGGFFSGLLGGLIGNQGAIRSAYLLNYPISKETFIVSAATIACLVDAARIPVYLYHYHSELAQQFLPLAIVTALTFLGTLVGKRLLPYISLERFKKFVAAMVILLGVCMTIGLL